MATFLAIFENNQFGDLPELRDEKLTMDNLIRPYSRINGFQYISDGNIGLEQLMITIEGLSDELAWIHFSGHYDEERGIRMMDGNFENLAETIIQCRNLKVLFINGCSSSEIFQTMSDNIPICIGTTEPIDDSIAAQFSQRFYANLVAKDDIFKYENIHDTFETCKSQIPSLINSLNLNRGGGNPQNYGSFNYKITENSSVNRKKFYEGILHFTRSIQNYEAKGGFQNFIEKELKIRPQQYWSKPPKFLQQIIKPLLAPGIRNEFKILGVERFELFTEYLHAILNLIRYSILSMLWEEIALRQVSKGQNPINLKYVKLLLIPLSDYSEEQVETLRILSKKIIIKFGNKNEINFTNKLIPLFEVISEGIKLTRGPAFVYDNELFWKTELLLQKLVKKTQFLNSYRIQSIFSKYYWLHRNYEKVQYEVECLYDDGTVLTEFEDVIGHQFENNHSVYLCQDLGEKEVVINLSPFYFDSNSYDPSANKVNLYVLDCYDEDESKFDFRESLDMLENNERSYKEIKEVKNSGYSLKSKNLYEQLSYFVSSLS